MRLKNEMLKLLRMRALKYEAYGENVRYKLVTLAEIIDDFYTIESKLWLGIVVNLLMATIHG